MRRLFAFGCSYTDYSFLTYADLLATSFDYYQNYGKSGCSNEYIFTKFIEAVSTVNFTKDDTVVIMWSESFRYSPYVTDTGYLGSHRGDSPYWIEKYGLNWEGEILSPEMSVIKSLTVMIAALEILKSLGVNYRMCFMSRSADVVTADFSNKNNHVADYRMVEFKFRNLDVLQSMQEKIKSYPNIIYYTPNQEQRLQEQKGFTVKYENGLYVGDNHPTPAIGVAWLKKTMPELIKDERKLNNIVNVFEQLEKKYTEYEYINLSLDYFNEYNALRCQLLNNGNNIWPNQMI